MNAGAILDTLLEASARAVAVAGLVAIVLAAFRLKTPAVRHAAWTSALAVMLLLPAASGVLPTVPMPAWVPRVPLRISEAVSAPSVQQPDGVSQVTRSESAQTRTTAVAAPMAAVQSLRPVSPPASRAAVEFVWTWREWAVLAWLSVALAFLLRELAGAWMARRLAQSGVPVEGDAHTFESPRIMTPVVVGVLAPRVMVPPSWSRWGAGVREMVLVHERAHVARRDPLTACLARLNRAVFWFHPVAWWLERHLARLSEQACDELVVRAVSEPRVYAAMLVEMARRLRQHGHRVAWQGIGVVDSRRFEDRVNRVLQGPAPQLSRIRKVALAGVSSALISVAVACGTSAAPLAEDPVLAQEIAAREASTDEYHAGVALTLDQVEDLERVVAGNPDDLAATSKLLTFYRENGQKLMGWNEMVAARRTHLLRLIARHPESDLTRWPFARRLDPDGYEKARTLWMAHVARPEVTTKVLSQAASFFEISEKAEAERLLLRAHALDPAGPQPRVSEGVYYPSWLSRLGVLYAKAIVGSDDETLFNVVKSVSRTEAEGPFARHAREVLGATGEASMLTAAAQFLHHSTRSVTLDFDQHALARKYAERAAAIRPGGPAQFLLDRFDEEGSYDRMVRLLGASAWEVKDAAFEPLSDELKLRYANGLIWGPHLDAMRAYQQKDDAAAQAALASFEARARHLLDVVARAPGTNLNLRVAADAHIALGTMAMRRGKTPDAVRHLQQAALAGRPMEKVDGVNDDTNSLGSVAAQRLTHELLSAGERETVASFYETASNTLQGQAKANYIAAAAAIRAGKMPESYQRYLARLK